MLAQVNGVSINYRIEGEGPWLTMSHSLACDLHMWDVEAKRLSRHFRVLRFDTRGHGASGAPPGPYSIEALTEDVRGLLDQLGVRETHFVGLSMGGMIGQTLALRHPELVSSLVLCDTSSRFALDVGERVKIVESGGLEPMVGPTLKRFLSEAFIARAPDVAGKVAAMIRGTPVPGYLGCCHAVSKLDITASLARIRCPVLVVVGENDAVTPVSMAREIQAAIAHAQLAVIPDAAHLSNIEQPEAFNQVVSGFLRRASGEGKPPHDENQTGLPPPAR